MNLVLFPLQVELEFALAYLKSRGLNSRPVEIAVQPNRPTAGRSYFEIENTSFVFAWAGRGKSQFGIVTQYLVDRLEKVESLICLGSGGAIALVFCLEMLLLEVPLLKMIFCLLEKAPKSLSSLRLKS